MTVDLFFFKFDLMKLFDPEEAKPKPDVTTTTTALNSMVVNGIM